MASVALVSPGDRLAAHCGFGLPGKLWEGEGKARKQYDYVVLCFRFVICSHVLIGRYKLPSLLVSRRLIWAAEI